MNTLIPKKKVRVRGSPIKDDSIHIFVRYKSRTVPFASGRDSDSIRKMAHGNVGGLSLVCGFSTYEGLGVFGKRHGYCIDI